MAKMGTGEDVCVQVLLPLALPMAYSYLADVRLGLVPGHYVRVPLGPREMVGVVWSIEDDGREAEEQPKISRERLKYVAERFDTPPMPDVQRQFVDWVAAYTVSAPGAVLRMCLRSTEALSPPKPQIGYRTGGVEPVRLTPQRLRVLKAAEGGLLWRPADLAEMAGVTAGVVRGLIEAGTLVGETLPPLEVFEKPEPRAHQVLLSSEQAEAARVLRSQVAARKYCVTLLDGVTGSGKTEVYFEAIAATLERGKQALLLLPEIALTKGFLQRFEKRFGVRPAEWHSGLTASARQRVWRGIALGQARVVVGARSSLFLPFSDLGLIVVDEEHDAAFKQEDGVIYHARDMAVVRGALGDFPVVLSSATPGLETLVNVDSGRYKSVQLTRRHAGASFPAVEIIDLKSDGPEPHKWIAPRLVSAIAETLGNGEQALLFLNRRGYAPLTLCRSCGYRFKCPDCDAWLVEHRFRRQLHCHHCGFHNARPEECPACHAEASLVACGPGVERIAEEAVELFPEARLSILSSDMTRGRTLSEMITDIAERKVDLIIGTQLVAKGHHFPGLTLVGVIDADIGFGQGDPRAAERTYQILRQVAGRAGREDLPGRALLQTYAPEHPAIEALVKGDRAAFYDYEREIRDRSGFPPFGRLASIILSGPSQPGVERFAKSLARVAPLAEGVRVLGPAPAPIAVIRGRHRYRLLVKTKRDFNMQKYLSQWLHPVKVPSNLRLSIDIDPQSFF